MYGKSFFHIYLVKLNKAGKEVKSVNCEKYFCSVDIVMSALTYTVLSRSWIHKKRATFIGNID